MMRRSAGFDADKARRQLLKEWQNVPALELTANDYVTCRVNSVDLKNRLSDIETNCRDRLHVWLLRIVGASTAPTSMALPCRWRSRPQHQKRTYEHHLLAAGGQAVRDIKPTHCSIRRCPSWRRQPGLAAGTGRADGRARTVATGVTPAARLCAGRLRIWRDLPDDGKVKGPSHWKRGIQDPIDESARQSSALSRSGRRAHCLLRRCGAQARS